MTKIKNTKKGMAKKTLSMSLVVAMLATSNVPVWAAEFSDGTDVAVTSETPAVEEFSDNTVETPVVEDEVTETSNAQVAEGYTVTTNLALKKVDWNTGLSLEATDGKTATFKIENKDGVEADWSKAEIWVGDSYWKAVEPTKLDTNLNSRLETVKYGLNNYKADSNVTVKVFVDKDTCVYEFESVIQPVDITDNKKCTLLEKKTSKTYNGTVQHPEIELTYKTSEGVFGIGASSDTTSEVVIQYEDVTYAKNVGSYKYKIVGVESEGYTGTITGKNFEITPATPTAENLSVTVSGSVAYGEDVKSLVTITDKYTNEVLPSDLYTVIAQSDAGEYTYKDITSITLKDKATIDEEDVNNNFVNEDVIKLLTEGNYTVSAFDLSALSEKYTVNVATKKINTPVTKGDITFTDKNGKTLKYDDVIPANVAIKTTDNTKPGNGTVTLTPTADAGKNVTGSFSTSFIVVDNIITAADVAFPAGSKFGTTKFETRTALTDSAAQKFIDDSLKGIVYNGSEQKPLEEAFAKLVLSNSVTTSDVELVLGKDYDLTYSNNVDSSNVSGKNATITLTFKGDYSGSWSYTFSIAKAKATVKGNDIEYVNGKTSYEPSVKVTTADGKEVPTSEYTITTTKKATKVGDTAKATVVFDNKNYYIDDEEENSDKYAYIEDVISKVVGKNLKNCTASIEGEYVYIGDSISPKLIVKDGDVTLVEGKDYKVSSQNNINAGKALVTIEAVEESNYTGSLTLEYEIKKADLANADVLNAEDKKDYDVEYDGTIKKPNIKTVKIGSVELKEYDPITKTGDYTITYDEAVNAGTYNFTITALASSKNVEGEFKGTFKVNPHELTAGFAPKLSATYDKKVIDVLPTSKTGATYTGKAITIDSFKTKYVVVDGESNILTEGKDYRLEYSNNVDAGLASVVAYGLGNHAVTDKDGKDVAIASMSYYIEGKGTIKTSWIKKISDTEYAGGLPVEPEVVVYDTNDNRLEQGVDYTVTTTTTKIGKYTGEAVTIKGKGAYISNNNGNSGRNAEINASDSLEWNVTKKDLANTTISVDKENNVTVMNGTVVVPSSEYDVAFSEDGKKVTVTAKADSKNYTGSKEIEVESAKVGQAMISAVEVVGNQATVVLSDDVENASGYDYVIATEADYQNGRIDVVKNQVKTTGKFTYVQEGTYYAYCHAWKRGEDGKKVFGEWSNLYKFTVTATTPSQPTITSVKASGSTVTVTYTASENATGYDVVLGTSSKKVNGEIRPVEYGELVKKNVKGNVVTVTFKNVEAGTYYAGLHAFNRTSEDGKKVFSQWSNVKKVTVK